MMRENLILDKSKAFALRMIKLYKYLQKEKKEFVISKQIVRSGMSIGANAKEASLAQSKPAFIAKMNIALGECGETEYWLELLYESGYINKESFDSLNKDNKELLKMLTAIIKSARESLKKLKIEVTN
jgi:four helix bundle protein